MSFKAERDMQYHYKNFYQQKWELLLLIQFLVYCGETILKNLGSPWRQGHMEIRCMDGKKTGRKL